MTNQHTSHDHNIAMLLVLSATTFLAFKGILAKFVYANGVPVDTLLLIRFTAATPIFWIIAIAAKATQAQYNKTNDSQTSPTTLPPWPYIGLSLCAGVVFYAGSRLDFTSLHYLPAGISRLILFTFPAIVLLFNAALNRQMPHIKHMVAFCITYLGLVILLNPATQTTTLSGFGILCGMGAAITYAAFLVINQRAMPHFSTLAYTALTNTVCLLCYATEALITPPEWHTGHDPIATIYLMALIVIFATVIPFFLMNEGVRRLGSSEASLIALTGPVITVCAAWIILEETMTAVQTFGCLVTLIGVAIMKGAIPRGLARRWNT